MEERDRGQEEHHERVQEVLESNDLSHTGLRTPFDQTIKPELYAHGKSAAELSQDTHIPWHLQHQETPLALAATAAINHLPLLGLKGETKGARKGRALPRTSAGPEKRPDFSMISTLGVGGMGRVLLATQHSLQREVAIKIAKAQGDSPLEAQALLHEGLIMGALPHPNIPPVYALGHDDESQPMLVMKQVEGVSWKALIEDPAHPLWGDEQPSPEAQVLRHIEILLDVCQATAFAHQRGILHRDIKPENVMIGAFGEVLLLDWGLALELDEEQEQTCTQFLGTPSFMAPEMVGGVLTRQTDVYLLGASLHFALVGEPRHLGESIHRVIFSVVESAPYDYPNTIPEDLAALCNKATHVDPSQRFESVVAFREAIAGYLQHRGSLGLTDVAAKRHAVLEVLLQEAEAKERISVQKDAITTNGPGRGESQRPRIESVFAECQFAYQQALQQWPDNPRAQAGRERCLEQMCTHELKCGRLESAAVFLQQFTHPPDELVAQFEVLKGVRAAEQDEMQRLQAFEEGLDFKRSPLPRLLLIVLLVLVLAFAGALSLLLDNPLSEFTYQDALVLDLCLLLAYTLYVVWQREVLFAQRIDRFFYFFMGIFLFVSLMHHWIGYQLGLPIRLAHIGEDASLAVLCAFAGMAIQRSLYLAALTTAITCLTMVLLPNYHLAVYSFNGIFLLVFALFLFYRQSKRIRVRNQAMVPTKSTD